MTHSDLLDGIGQFPRQERTNAIPVSNLELAESSEPSGRLKDSRADHTNTVLHGPSLPVSLTCPTLDRRYYTKIAPAGNGPGLGFITPLFTEPCTQYAYSHAFSKAPSWLITSSHTSNTDTKFPLQPLQRGVLDPLTGRCPLDLKSVDLFLSLSDTSAGYPLQTGSFDLDYSCTNQGIPAMPIGRHEEQGFCAIENMNAISRPNGQMESFLTDSSHEDFYATSVTTQSHQRDTFHELRISGNLYDRRTGSQSTRKATPSTSTADKHVPNIIDSIETSKPTSPYLRGSADNSTDDTLYERHGAANWQTTDCFNTTPMCLSFGSEDVASEQFPRALPYIAPDKENLDSRTRCFEDYIKHLRGLLVDGRPETEVLGSTRISLDWLFEDSVNEKSVHLPLSQWIAGIVATFEVLGVPEKIGLTVLYSRYLRVIAQLPILVNSANVSQWFVTRSLHDYYRIPQWLRPTLTQTTIEHNIWIDFVLW